MRLLATRRLESGVGGEVRALVIESVVHISRADIKREERWKVTDTQGGKWPCSEKSGPMETSWCSTKKLLGVPHGTFSGFDKETSLGSARKFP